MNQLALMAVLSCGGLFGEAGYQGVQAKQTGARVLFWIDRSGSEPYVETHIQLQYASGTDRFAWIMPIAGVPTVSVGSQGLIDELLWTSVPLFNDHGSQFGEHCDSASHCAGDYPDPDYVPEGFEGYGGWNGEWLGDRGTPSIDARGSAGAFEWAVLSGDSTQEILDWLDDHGYAQNPDAVPILEEYVQEGFSFLAVKLTTGDKADVHPLVIRQPGTELRLPIRLGSISGIPDTSIRVLFLGESRVAPTNWPHVVLNQTRYAWWGDTNYHATISQAIDEAGGRAFMTESALPYFHADEDNLVGSRWDATAFEDIAPELVVDELRAQDLYERHPLVKMLLERYLPPPDGVEANEFWNCLSCYVDQIDPNAWSTEPGFAADFQALIVDPGEHAIDLLSKSNYLTRLFTRMGPGEMIEDALFHETHGLPNVHHEVLAELSFDCDNQRYIIMWPDGRGLVMTDDGPTPELTDNPAALRIERIPLEGPPTIEVDNGEQIDAALDAYNADKLIGPHHECSVHRVRFESLFTFFAIFGIAWFNRGSRRRRGN